MKILVTGASGFVGSAAAERLVLLGHEVRPLLRRASNEADAPLRRGGLSKAVARDAVVIDEWSFESLARASEGCDAVVHAAAIVHRPNALPQEYERFNVQGTKDLLRACERSGIRRMVFLSSIKVYGEEPTQVMDEATPLRATLPYAETKGRAEALALAATFPAGQVALRLAPVYGVGDKGNVRKMVERISKGRLVVPGSGDTRKSIVHITTVVAAIEKAVLWPERQGPSLPSGAFVVANSVSPRVGDLADLMARLLNKRSPRRVAERILHPVARVGDWLASFVPKHQTDLEGLVRKSLLQTVCDPSKLRTTLGVNTDTNLEANLLEEIAWLRSIQALS
jgi:nucleoside-diphosphate-sugar epimerase